MRASPILRNLAIVAGNCFALDPARAVSQYTREVWGLRNGLPRGQISSITQSADGYLWIGTEQGARKFDGVSFTTPRGLGRDNLPPDHVLQFALDSSGGLWLRLRGPTIVRYQHGSFAPMAVRANHDPLVGAMAQMSDGSVLFASRLDGIFRWNRAGFQTIVAKEALPTDSPIVALAESEGDLWIGTSDYGVYRMHSGVIRQMANEPHMRINCLLAGAHRELYVGTSKGLMRWDGDRLTQAGLPERLMHAPILALTKDRDANIWIGTDKGLLRLNAQGVSTYGEADTGNAISSLFEDREGDVWAGSVDELQRLHESAFITYRSDGFNGKERVGAIHADAQGRIWFAPVSGGLYSLRDGANKEFAVPGLDGDEVYSIAGDEDLWLGRKRGGLTDFSLRDGLRSYKDAGAVFAVHQSRDGTVWAGTLTDGVRRFQNGQFTNYTTADGLISNTVFSIAEEADGSMWFAGPSGFSRLGHGRWTKFGAENVNTLFEDGGGVLWLGTLRGIALIRAGRIAVPPGLPSSLRDQIFGIAEDRLGSFWITTASGVLRVDRAKLLSGSLSREDVREFGIADGLLDSQGVRRERSITADPSGRIWLSTTGGILSIDPARLRHTAVPTIVNIDHMVVDGEERSLTSSMRLRPGSKRVVIVYAGLNLSAPEAVRFRFKLDGFEANWSSPDAGKEAVYTNLGPGQYVFHVIGSNADHVWNQAEATLSFRVEPALWQARWFQAAAILGFALSLLLLYRARLRQVTQQVNNRFEARLTERTRIARELHDTLLQSFHGLMLRFQAVQNLLPEHPSEAKQSLEIAIDRAASAITEGRDAIQELRNGELASRDLVGTLTDLGRDLAIAGKPPSYRVLVEGAQRPLHPSLQEDLYLISREAVVNAFRHARATYVELDVRYDARFLRLRVRDDGIGMDPGILAKGGVDGHWGLPGMQERAKTIHGSLEIWSEVSRGTEIELNVPANVAYSEFKRSL